MANRIKGDVDLVAGEKTYTLRLGFDCLERLEEATGQPIEATFRNLSDTTKPRLKTMRLVIWCGLREFHPEVTLADVGAIISEVGMVAMMDALGQAAEANFPQDLKAAVGGTSIADPQTADVGTGPDSSDKPSSQG